jgi:hypothetical protein
MDWTRKVNPVTTVSETGVTLGELSVTIVRTK